MNFAGKSRVSDWQSMDQDCAGLTDVWSVEFFFLVGNVEILWNYKSLFCFCWIYNIISSQLETSNKKRLDFYALKVIELLVLDLLVET
ncbi:hypothetical protein LWI29_030578 [Acer saccharum]|uniref:Uncharacterized protein n=1 Tax=Acer saccharum TaxID=4024 RepID=A0AA39VME9_ACESA|nr:hypothetical protein LWI29_030578 [Acer saccharum]